MLTKIKQVLEEWSDRALDDNFRIIIPFKYRNHKIKNIQMIILDNGETFIYHED